MYDRPLYPKKTGDGIIPWISGKGVKTRLFLNTMRDPSLKEISISASIEKYSANGEIEERKSINIGNEKINIVELTENKTDDLTYGYCYVKLDENPYKTVSLQFHLQYFASHTYAMTHGRAKGQIRYYNQNLLDIIIGLLDKYPYSASTAFTAESATQVSFLVLNVTNLYAKYSYRYSNGDSGSFCIPANGSYMLNCNNKNSETIKIQASRPFTFYIIMSKKNMTALTIQHIQDKF